MSDTDIIIKYIKEGETNSGRLGLELEHFVLDSDDRPIPFEVVSPLLERTGKMLGAELLMIDGRVMGYSTEEYTVTLEPSCQFEISISPFEKLSDIRRVYNRFRKLWYGIFQKEGYRILTAGLSPLPEQKRVQVEAFPLIPKRRYEMMDRYFQTSGRYGRYMMRASASTQVSVDYSSEEDLLRKLRLIQKISPFLMLLMETKTDRSSYLDDPERRHLLRTQVWDDLDPDRTGWLPGSLDETYGLGDYAETVLNRPLILLTKDGETTWAGNKSIRELGVFSPELTEHVISMFFFHVRVKKYLEIRVADAADEKQAIAYAALIKGLLYDKDTLRKTESLLERVRDTDRIRRAVDEIEKYGYDAMVYDDLSAREWCSKLLNLAWQGLKDAEERNCLKQLGPGRTGNSLSGEYRYGYGS